MVCGLGSIGRRHLRNLRSLGEKDIVLLRSGMSTLPDDDLAGLPVERDLDAALERWRPEGVIVSNPTALHLEAAIPAAQKGCHLLIEKPLSHNLDRICELRSAVAAGGGKVLMGFQFRFHPRLQLVKRLLEEGAIGRPLSVRAHWGEYLPGWHPGEDYRLSYSARADLGGGVVLTLCHPFDYLRWLIGEVSSVSAHVGKLSDLDLEVEDTAEIGLGFAAGLTGSLHLDFVQRPPEHRLEVIGGQGTIVWDGLEGSTGLFTAERGAWQMFPAPSGFERNDMFVAEMRHFIEVVSGRAAPACTLEDGESALRLALGVLAASKERRLVSFSEGTAR
jgi:predicted dehydrogenase